MAVSVEDVVAAYRVIFDRSPSADEIQSQQHNCTDFAELRTRLLASGEFQQRVLGSVIPLCKPLDWPPLDIDVDVTQHQLRSMIERTERNFKYLGEHEPHWSVLSADRYLSANIQTSDEEFFASGREPLHRLQATAARCGIDLSGYRRCFELGCGLGRTTRWLADEFAEVIGADISASHLALAREAMTRFGKQNVTLLKVDTIAAFAECPVSTFSFR
jgi:tRNA/tmRNA/rRNA uracil-C5-methylase (TrmA/RlmC/RlmD family)